MNRLFLLTLVVSTLSVTPAASVNLHRKHGPTWDCSYITTGTPYKDACLACEAQGKQFDQRGDGGICVGGGTPNFPSPRDADYGSTQERGTRVVTPPSRKQQPTQNRKWGAVASGIWRTSNGGVGAAAGGSWNYSTKEAAEQRALQECNARGQNCTVDGTFNNGCGYAVIGTSDRGKGVFIGSTLDSVYSKCRAKYSSCGSQSGGCITD